MNKRPQLKYLEQVWTDPDRRDTESSCLRRSQSWRPQTMGKTAWSLAKAIAFIFIVFSSSFTIVVRRKENILVHIIIILQVIDLVSMRFFSVGLSKCFFTPLYWTSVAEAFLEGVLAMDKFSKQCSTALFRRGSNIFEYLIEQNCRTNCGLERVG